MVRPDPVARNPQDFPANDVEPESKQEIGVEVPNSREIALAKISGVLSFELGLATEDRDVTELGGKVDHLGGRRRLAEEVDIDLAKKQPPLDALDPIQRPQGDRLRVLYQKDGLDAGEFQERPNGVRLPSGEPKAGIRHDPESQGTHVLFPVDLKAVKTELPRQPYGECRSDQRILPASTLLGAARANSRAHARKSPRGEPKRRRRRPS